jgi:isopentenyl diphosphate isomerase/L-lactate dehydrogenase-like FMN-dependent dehydrogenase
MAGFAQALAMGATAVGVGRPLLFALAIGGQAGVQRALHILRGELTNNMALLGCSSLGDIHRRVVIAPGDKYW